MRAQEFPHTGDFLVLLRDQRVREEQLDLNPSRAELSDLSTTSVVSTIISIMLSCERRGVSRTLEGKMDVWVLS